MCLGEAGERKANLAEDKPLAEDGAREASTWKTQFYVVKRSPFLSNCFPVFMNMRKCSPRAAEVFALFASII